MQISQKKQGEIAMKFTTMALLVGLGIIMTVLFPTREIFWQNNTLAAGYDKNEGSDPENSCGNGILPENIPCTNAGSEVVGDKNTVRLDGIVFP